MLAWAFAAGVGAVATWRTAVAHTRIGRSAAYGRVRSAHPAPAHPAPAHPAPAHPAPGDPAGRLGVVVPLLAEQRRLPGLLAHFDLLAAGLPGLELHLVTSEKEGRGPDSTYALCRTAGRDRPYLRHHHCPDAEAIMAHQLNVVCDSPDAPERLVFYNADSRPAAESIRFAGDVLGSTGDVLGSACSAGPRVCQQYGAYLANAEDLTGAASPVLLAAALWQTRWSQSFELARALENLAPERLGRLRQRRLEPGRGRLPRMNYVVGHGLAIRRRLLTELGGFSTRWHNEDAVLGLNLALAGEPIVPNPYLEPADSPDTLRGLVVQKSVWWTGPGLAPWYARQQDAPGARGGRLWDAWMTAALTHHAVCWLVGPTVLAAAVALTATAPAAGLVSIAAVWVYLAWPNDTAARRLPDFGLARPSGAVRLRGALGAPVMYLLHGLSAWLGLARAVVRVFVADLGKPKTPMRSSPRPTWRNP